MWGDGCKHNDRRPALRCCFVDKLIVVVSFLLPPVGNGCNVQLQIAPKNDLNTIGSTGVCMNVSIKKFVLEKLYLVVVGHRI